ncbi:MAG: squalene/phytoene synthase family protein, partial [Rhodospirillales bacterium]|nr:squalene/phytoene synthase family protein [Rhodospirillales bacterium]
MTFDTHSMIYLDREIEKKVRKAGSSFYWAMRLLDAEKRRAMYAVYAFCREVDDIADGQDPETKKREDLNKWRTEIDQVYTGKPESRIGSTLLSIVTQHQLQKTDFLAVI